jgi:hypothetical protein
VRRLLAAVLVVAVLLVAAEVGLRLWAQSAAAATLREAFRLPRDTTVEIVGFPFLVECVTGHVDRARAEATDVPVDGLRVESVEVTLEDVRFGCLELLRGRGGVRAGEAILEGTVTERAASVFVQEAGFPVTLRFLGPDVRVSARIEVAGAATSVSATGPLVLRGRTLSFEPEALEEDVPVPPGSLAFSVRLPSILPGVSVRRVTVRDGRATLEGIARDVRFSVEG